MEVFQTSQFKKDLKRQRRRNKDLSKLKRVVEYLIVGEPLPAKYRDHTLVGNWQGSRDCHIEGDWVLIYRVDGAGAILFLERTRTHSDLFK